MPQTGFVDYTPLHRRERQTQAADLERIQKRVEVRKPGERLGGRTSGDIASPPRRARTSTPTSVPAAQTRTPSNLVEVRALGRRRFFRHRARLGLGGRAGCHSKYGAPGATGP